MESMVAKVAGEEPVEEQHLGTILVGDVGGTNARFALYRYPRRRPDQGVITHRETREVVDYGDFDSSLSAYLQAVGHDASELDGACLAVASAVVNDQVTFTNSPWRFSITSIARQFAFKRMKVVNDFEALGFSIGQLPEKSSMVVQRGAGAGNGTEIVLGPGTGLGIAMLHRESGVIVPSEGGHISFAPTDNDERELLDFISAEFPRVSYERILSGAGLARLYSFQRQRLGNPIDASQVVRAADVVTRAGDQSDPAARWAIDRFLKVLGHFAGDSVLMFGGFRGVYLAGGILPRISSDLLGGGFLQRFNEKGRFSGLLKDTPIHLIVDDTASLRGAAIRLLVDDGFRER